MYRLHSNRAAPAPTPPKKQEGYAALSTPHQDVDSLSLFHLLFTQVSCHHHHHHHHHQWTLSFFQVLDKHVLNCLIPLLVFAFPHILAPPFTSATWSPSYHSLYYYSTRTSLPILPTLAAGTHHHHRHHHTHDHQPPTHAYSFHRVSVALAFFYAFTTTTDEEATRNLNVAVFLRSMHASSYVTSWFPILKNEMRLSSTPPSLCFTTALHRSSGPYKERAGRRGLCVTPIWPSSSRTSMLVDSELALEEWVWAGFEERLLVLAITKYYTYLRPSFARILQPSLSIVRTNVFQSN